MSLIEKTKRLIIRLDDSARDSSNVAATALATYRTLVNHSARHAKIIENRIRFPLQYSEARNIFEQADVKRLNRLSGEVERAKSAVGIGDFDSAKTRQQSTKRSLEALEKSADAIYKDSISKAISAAKKVIKPRAEFDFICRSLANDLGREFTEIHKVLDRVVVEDSGNSSIADLGGEKFRNILQRYTEIIIENEVELPPDVAVFVSKARDRYSSTTLGDLSPEVLSYLIDHGLANGFVVAPTKY